MLPGMFGAEVLFLFPIIFPVLLVVMCIWVMWDDDWKVHPPDSPDSPAAPADPAPPSRR